MKTLEDITHPDQELKLVSGYEFCDHYEVWRVNFTLVKILTAAREPLIKDVKDPWTLGLGSTGVMGGGQTKLN